MADKAHEMGLGFREAPEKVTYACMIYMARVMELRDFVSFFFGVINSSQQFASGLAPESAAKFEAEAGKYKIVDYSYSVHRQFVNEVMLSRAVESFDLYILTMLRLIFMEKPEMLKSEGAIDIATVFELKNIEDIVRFVAERKVYELGYKSLSDLRKYIQSRTGIDLFASDEAYNMVVLASEVRNLIAHNDCRVNDIFCRRIAGMADVAMLPVSDTEKFEISDEWLRRASYTLDSVVFGFDEAAAAKFDLQRLNRMSSFIFRQ
jgi:hypothetical protein